MLQPIDTDGWHGRKFTPGKRRYLDLADLYTDALAGLPEELDATAPLPVPQTCPVTLEELLAPPPEGA